MPTGLASNSSSVIVRILPFWCRRRFGPQSQRNELAKGPTAPERDASHKAKDQQDGLARRVACFDVVAQLIQNFHEVSSFSHRPDSTLPGPTPARSERARHGALVSSPACPTPQLQHAFSHRCSRCDPCRNPHPCQLVPGRPLSIFVEPCPDSTLPG